MDFLDHHFLTCPFIFLDNLLHDAKSIIFGSLPSLIEFSAFLRSLQEFVHALDLLVIALAPHTLALIIKLVDLRLHGAFNVTFIILILLAVFVVLH